MARRRNLGMQAAADRRCHQVIVRGFGETPKKISLCAKIVLALCRTLCESLPVATESDATPNQHQTKTRP